jgi:hypothetical protein
MKKLMFVVLFMGISTLTSLADSITWTAKPAEVKNGIIVASGYVLHTKNMTPSAAGCFAMPKKGGIVKVADIFEITVITDEKFQFKATFVSDPKGKMVNDDYSVWISINFTGSGSNYFIGSSVEDASVVNGNKTGPTTQATISFAPDANLKGAITGKGTYTITDPYNATTNPTGWFQAPVSPVQFSAISSGGGAILLQYPAAAAGAFNPNLAVPANDYQTIAIIEVFDKAGNTQRVGSEFKTVTVK